MFTCTQQTCFLSSSNCKSQNVQQSLQVASERETKTMSLRQYCPLARGLYRLEIPARHSVSTVTVAASFGCPWEQLGVVLREIVVPFARAIQYIYIYIYTYIYKCLSDGQPPGSSDGRPRGTPSAWLTDLLEKLPSKSSKHTKQVFQSHQASLPSKSFKQVFQPSTCLEDLFGRLAWKTCLED